MYIEKLLNEPIGFLKSYQDNYSLDGVYCTYCKCLSCNKTKRFKNTRSLYFHLKQFHSEEITIDVVIEILNSVSKARQIGMIK